MILRQTAFAGKEKLLKGALHVHTTRSDGQDSPEEVIRLHQAMGYDFMALTDHNLYNCCNLAPGTDITILPGVERDHRLPGGEVHTFHTVCLGPRRESGNGYQQDQRFEGGLPVADQFAYQPILDDMHAHGNITLYCHPEWSGTPAREFEHLRGNFAMEIWNSGTVLENDMDHSAHYWDELLMQGQRLWGVATDDGHIMAHHGHGWVMVRAENDVDGILSALERGAFYSTCGPEIYDFYVENGKAVLLCSPCAYVGFAWGGMPHRLTHSAEGRLTHAKLTLHPAYTYIRGIVKDAQGRKAWTNPIFL